MLMVFKFALISLSISLAVVAYYITSAGTILKLGAQGILLTLLGAIAFVASTYAYGPICTRKQLTGKERLAFLFSGILPGAFGGLSAIFFGIFAFVSDDYSWRIGVIFAALGVASFHIGLVVAIVAYVSQKKSSSSRG